MSAQPLLVTFAGGGDVHTSNARALVVSCGGAGLRSRLTTPETLPLWFLHEYGSILSRHRRGYGCWCWKPAVVLDALEHCAQNEVVIYSDAGCIVHAPAVHLGTVYRDYDLVAFDKPFPPPPFSRNVCYCSSRCIEEMGATVQHQMETQTEANFFMVRNNERAKRFLSEWLWWLKNEEILTGNDAQDRMKGCFFIAHRHDQSVFSLLLRKYEEEEARAVDDPARRRLSLKLEPSCLRLQYVSVHRRRSVDMDLGTCVGLANASMRVLCMMEGDCRSRLLLWSVAAILALVAATSMLCRGALAWPCAAVGLLATLALSAIVASDAEKRSYVVWFLKVFLASESQVEMALCKKRKGGVAHNPCR